METFLMLMTLSAAVAVLSCLVSESEIAAPVRDKLKWRVLYCPICLGFWFAIPTLFASYHYFLIVAMSNAWMLIILKVYEALDAVGED